MLLLGNISLKAHQYQEAEHHFRTVLAMDQTAFKAYIGLGHTALLQRHLGKAEEYYLHPVFLSIDEISPQLAFVNFYLAIQRYDDAEETLRLALARYHDNIMLQMSLVGLYIKTHRSREATDLLEAVLASMPFSDSVKIMAVRQYFVLGNSTKPINLSAEYSVVIVVITRLL
jgi:tetratricopeptide (TPR) repeat protein